MFRHVVMFRWQAECPAERRAASVQALHDFAKAVADLGTVTVGVDAGISEGNFDVVVIADFIDKERYLAYAADPRHRELLAAHIAPFVQMRAAVQYRIEPAP